MSATETEKLAAELAAKPRSLAAALVAALAELTVLDRTRTASIPTKSGGSFTYNYADISDVVAATRPVLASHGLVALTPVHGSEKGLAVSVTLIHESGEEMTFEPLPFVASQDPQQAGSAITYFRRYALLAALGMATADDDGAAAKSAPRKSTRSTPATPAVPKLDAKGAPERPKCPICELPLTGVDTVQHGSQYVHERCAAS